MMPGPFFRRAVACLLIAGLAGCGGGGNTGTVPPPGETPVAGVTSGIAVDPYIKGAKFQEIGADGVAKDNISEPSDDKGIFTFPKALTQGSTIVLASPGQHNGVLYDAILKRKVDVATGELVVSPITTLLAGGADEGELAAALEVDKSLLKTNPMAPLEKTGEVTDDDLKLLKASIMAHAAIKNPTLTVSQAVAMVKPIVDKLTAAEYKTSPATLNTVVALRDYFLEAKASDDTLEARALEQVFEQVREAFKAGATAVTINKTEGGYTAGGGASAPLPTAKEFFDKGMAALQVGLVGSGSMLEIQEAANNFKFAETAIDTNTLPVDKDAIRFFSAFSQLASLADTASGDGTGLNRLGDLLDAFGVAKGAERNLFQMIKLPQDCQPVDFGGYTYMECNQLPLPATTPTTGAIQAFLSGKFAPQLQAVVTSLGKVSSAFNYSWADPGDVAPTEIDHADVLIFKAVAQGILGQINIQAAYNVDVDLYAQEQQDATGTDTPQAFLERNPELGKLVDVAKLTQAKTFLTAGLADMENALAGIRAETDEQVDDLIAFYSPADMIMVEEDLALAKAALVGEVILPGTTPRKINAAIFFSPGVNLRAMVPAFNGDVPGLFPDPTFGGILVSGFDLDDDGAPDFMTDFSRISYGVLAQNSAWEGNFWGMDGSVYLNLEGTDTLSAADDTFQALPYYNGPVVSSGTWAVVNGELVLTTQQEVITLTLEYGYSTYLNVSWSSSTGGYGFGQLYGGSGGGGGIAPAPVQ